MENSKKEDNQKQDKEWICSVCGYKHVGPEPPKKCPVCGVDGQYFDAVEVHTGIDERSLLQAVDTAVSMNAAGDHGTLVPDYVDENISTKIIQSYTGIVNRMVWRKY